MNDVETDLRATLARRAAVAGDGVDTYSAVRRRIAVRRQRRVAAAATLSIVAVVGGVLGAARFDGGGAARPAAPGAAGMLDWAPRGNARGDAALLDKAVDLWRAAPSTPKDGAASVQPKVLWAGGFRDDPSSKAVFFQTVDSRGVRLVVVAGAGSSMRLIADLVAPPPTVHQVSVAVTGEQEVNEVPAPGATAGPPSYDPIAEMPILVEPGGTVTRVGSDREEWTTFEESESDGLVSYMGGYSDLSKVRVYVDTADGGVVAEPITGSVKDPGDEAPEGQDVDPHPSRGENTGTRERTKLGWSTRVAGPEARIPDGVAERVLTALDARLPGPGKLTFKNYWKRALPDGTVAVLGVAERGDVDGSHLALYVEARPGEGRLYVLRRLEPHVNHREVTAYVTTASGTGLLVIGAPTTSAIRYLPQGGEPHALDVTDGWGFLALSQPATERDRVELTFADETHTAPVAVLRPI